MDAKALNKEVDWLPYCIAKLERCLANLERYEKYINWMLKNSARRQRAHKKKMELAHQWMQKCLL